LSNFYVAGFIELVNVPDLTAWFMRKFMNKCTESDMKDFKCSLT